MNVLRIRIIYLIKKTNVFTLWCFSLSIFKYSLLWQRSSADLSRRGDHAVESYHCVIFRSSASFRRPCSPSRGRASTRPSTAWASCRDSRSRSSRPLRSDSSSVSFAYSDSLTLLRSWHPHWVRMVPHLQDLLTNVLFLIETSLWARLSIRLGRLAVYLFHKRAESFSGMLLSEHLLVIALSGILFPHIWQGEMQLKSSSSIN